MSDAAPLDNAPALWHALFPFPQPDGHKYSRGTALIRGGAVMTSAARLAARAAQRAGAGLVTVAAPSAALPIYAQALESVIVRPCDTLTDWRNLLEDARHPALLIGPGLGLSDAARPETLAVLSMRRSSVIDADALTCFADAPDLLCHALHDQCVLTPHEGEFARLFGAIKDDRVGAAQDAARRAGCVLVLKGADTVIAAPDGATFINHAAPPWLATAGSGDVLAGLILGLIAQKMPVFQAAAAAVWIHAQAAQRFGLGLIAEDIVAEIPAIVQGV